MMDDQMRIGCSGYYYPYWKNRFYPQGLKPKDWLEYYSTVFNTVELNGTFYRTPKLSDLARYQANTGEDFVFSVKMNKYVTHVLRLEQCRQQVADFIGLMEEGLGSKLACILFQLPPTFHFTEENATRIFQHIPHESRCVVEFRHASWWNRAVQEAFTRSGITFCNVDFPGLDVPMIHTTDVFYLRLHGNPELFKSSYSQERLQQVASEVKSHKKSFVYFNNTFYTAGYSNAQELMTLLV